LLNRHKARSVKPPSHDVAHALLCARTKIKAILTKLTRVQMPQVPSLPPRRIPFSALRRCGGVAYFRNAQFNAAWFDHRSIRRRFDLRGGRVLRSRNEFLDRIRFNFQRNVTFRVLSSRLKKAPRRGEAAFEIRRVVTHLTDRSIKGKGVIESNRMQGNVNDVVFMYICFVTKKYPILSRAIYVIRNKFP